MVFLFAKVKDPKEKKIVCMRHIDRELKIKLCNVNMYRFREKVNTNK